MTASRATRREQSGRPARAQSSVDAGFTLIEVIVALALFALIAAAGTAMVDTVLNVEARTASRLARLADIERAIVIITHDLTGIAGAPLAGGPAGIVFARHGDRDPFGVGYDLSGATFERVANGRRQPMLDRVTAARWQFYSAADGWGDRWPRVPTPGTAWPLAVAVDITLTGAGPRGIVRRIVVLPVRALPAGVTAP